MISNAVDTMRQTVRTPELISLQKELTISYNLHFLWLRNKQNLYIFVYNVVDLNT